MFKLDWDRSIGAKVMEGFVLVVRFPPPQKKNIRGPNGKNINLIRKKKCKTVR